MEAFNFLFKIKMTVVALDTKNVFFGRPDSFEK